MNLFDNIVIWNGERKLKPFRSQAEILKRGEFKSYSEYFPIIEQCYKNASYWHGTGRLHYSHTENSRYETNGKTGYLDILDSIINMGGITPHSDNWFKRIERKDFDTISFTPCRMYVKLYAGLHLYEKDQLVYEFGTTKFWFRTIICVQTFYKKFLVYIFTGTFYRILTRANNKNAREWMGAVRSDMQKKSMSIFRGHLLRSDIPGNYPIIIGINKSGLDIISYNSGMERFEARTRKSILIKDMTHIEVPLCKVEETKEFLKQKNCTLMVIPIEFSELYCSNRSLQELLYTL